MQGKKKVSGSPLLLPGAPSSLFSLPTAIISLTLFEKFCKLTSPDVEAHFENLFTLRSEKGRRSNPQER